MGLLRKIKENRELKIEVNKENPIFISRKTAYMYYEFWLLTEKDNYDECVSLLSPEIIFRYIKNNLCEIRRTSSNEVIGMIFSTEVSLFNVLIYYSIDKEHQFIKNKPMLTKIAMTQATRLSEWDWDMEYLLYGESLKDQINKFITYGNGGVNKPLYQYAEDFTFIPVTWIKNKIEVIKKECEFKNVLDPEIKAIPKGLELRNSNVTIAMFIRQFTRESNYTDLFNFDIINSNIKDEKRRYSLSHYFLYEMKYKNQYDVTVEEFLDNLLREGKRAIQYGGNYSSEFLEKVLEYITETDN